jgi:hypothetical protein
MTDGLVSEALSSASAEIARAIIAANHKDDVR